MRWLYAFVLPLCLLPGRTPPLHAQEKKTQITEVLGHSIEYWINEIRSKDQSKSENAIRTVLMFGPERAYQAAPVILDRLRKHTPFAPVDTSIRVNGAMALGLILGGYRDADPKVIRDTVMILKRLLSDDQSIVKFRAAQALGRIGIDAREAIPEMIGVVKDPKTYETRQAAAIALGQIAFDKNNGPTFTVLKALYGALGDTAVQVRLASIQSLTQLGGPVDPTLRLGLVQALEPVIFKDPEPSVRIWAIMAHMSIIKSINKERVEIIHKFLQHADPTVRIQSAQALGTIGRDAKSCIPTLIATLKDPEVTVVVWAVWALGKMEQSAANAVPMLESIKADSAQPELLRKMAEESIEQISGKRKVNLP